MLDEYKGFGKPLRSDIARDLIVELFGNIGIRKKKEIVDSVPSTHLQRGGMPLKTKDVDQFIGNRLDELRSMGLAENFEDLNTEKGYWRISKTSRKTNTDE